ncbi:hypothetical protein ABW20_dc0109735 [Dactylellina cionopaga]|nr:hypothetical protein ABW20_dc0109735 [Dactylellina cionopaga]
MADSTITATSGSFHFGGPYISDDDTILADDSFRSFLDTFWEQQSSSSQSAGTSFSTPATSIIFQPELQDTINPVDLRHETTTPQSPRTHSETIRNLPTPNSYQSAHGTESNNQQAFTAFAPPYQLPTPQQPFSPTHRRSQKYCCTEPGCPFTITNLKKLGDHMRDIHKAQGFKCPYCDTRVTRHDNLTSHYRACDGMAPADRLRFSAPTTAKSKEPSEVKRSAVSTRTAVAMTRPSKRQRVSTRTLPAPPAPPAPISTPVSTTSVLTISTSTANSAPIRIASSAKPRNSEKEAQVSRLNEARRSQLIQQQKAPGTFTPLIRDPVDDNGPLVLSPDAGRNIIVQLTAKVESLTAEKEALKEELRKTRESLAQRDGERDVGNREFLELIKTMFGTDKPSRR